MSLFGFPGDADSKIEIGIQIYPGMHLGCTPMERKGREETEAGLGGRERSWDFLQSQQGLHLDLQGALNLGWPFTMVLSLGEGTRPLSFPHWLSLIIHWMGPPQKGPMTLGSGIPFSRGTSSDPPARSTFSTWGSKFWERGPGQHITVSETMDCIHSFIYPTHSYGPSTVWN